MRARQPDVAGAVERDGISIAYEIHGTKGPTVILVPVGPITHSAMWKGQLHELPRHCRVITMDSRGNGKSDRPTTIEGFMPAEFAADIIAVLDATDTDQAFLIGHCASNYWNFLVAAANPERVKGVIALSPNIPYLGGVNPVMVEVMKHWEDDPEDPQGWLTTNPNYWRRGGYPHYLEFFFNEIATEPHSSKIVEDLLEWGLETDVETMILDSGATYDGLEENEALCRSLTSPVLVVHGTNDRCALIARGERVAELTNARYVRMEGAGHLLPGREPVAVNREILDFLRSLSELDQPKHWSSGRTRRRKALVVSSPIGLGHARRDIAIADELAKLEPDLDIEWLSQDPVTSVLREGGHVIHPASEWMANESAHIASEASGHDLHAFQAIRNMDEILLANFQIFQEVVEEGHHDVVIADEAWDIDHFWHENPELKRATQVWLTDFVGALPMPEGGEYEAALVADHNLQMVEHVERFPGIRDVSLFVGDSEDLVPDRLGPDLPTIKEWTEAHYSFLGYITGFTPPTPEERTVMREQFGYRDNEKVCLVAVGGSGVGTALIERTLESFPYAKREIPDLRMIVVAGPRIEPAILNAPPGVEVMGYVDRLHRQLSVCDVAVVQGGLTTTMELTAAQRPFLYFPLRNHFEQNRHVRHRLERHRAGRHMDFHATTAEDLAAGLVDEISRTVDYVPVPDDGAHRAARHIAELI